MTTDESPVPTLARWKIALLVLILITLLFGVCEFATRVYLRVAEGYDGKHLYQFQYDPYKNILPEPNFVDTRGVKNNAQGFRRDTNVVKEKPAGTYRIFLMGGSTAYGLGGLWSFIDNSHPVLKNSETIDAWLEHDLQAVFPDRHIEVINAAITSTWTHHHLIYLNQTLLNYHPDMVLFLDGFNDFFFFDKGHDQFAGYTYSLPSKIIMGDPTLYSLLYANAWWVYRKSAFAHLLADGARNVGRAIAGKPKQRPLEVAQAMDGLKQVFPRSALKMHERSGLILRNEGVVPVFMLQPMLILERDRTQMPAVERRMFDFNVSSYRPNYEAFMHQAVDFVRERESAMAEKVGGTFIDLTEVFRGTEGQAFTDYAHLTPHGNELLARYVAGRIEPLIRGAPAGH